MMGSIPRMDLRGESSFFITVRLGVSTKIRLLQSMPEECETHIPDAESIACPDRQASF